MSLRPAKSQDENDEAEYQFVNPVAEVEKADQQERVEAFHYQNAQRLKSFEEDDAEKEARLALQESLRRVYSIPTMAETAAARVNPLGLTPDAIRRAIIITEILQPPRSRRAHR